MHRLLRPSLCHPLAGCARALHCRSQWILRSQAENLLRRRPPSHLVTRRQSRRSRSQEDEWRTRNKTVLTYIAAAGVGMIGLSYAAVPLYRLYCQVRRSLRHTAATHLSARRRCDPFAFHTGRGAWWHGCSRARHGPGGDDDAGEGTRHQGHLQRRHARQHPVELQTPADGDLRKTSRSTLRTSCQSKHGGLPADPSSLQVVPGETALAFYRAKNPTDKPIIGISTYNVVPFDAGQYFNKIQVISERQSAPPFHTAEGFSGTD